MTMLMLRVQIKRESLQAFEDARNKLLLVLSQVNPTGVRYTWCDLPDGTTFIGLLELAEGVENPLPGIEGGKEFQTHLQDWIAAPPVREEWKIVAVYPYGQETSAT